MPRIAVALKTYRRCLTVTQAVRQSVASGILLGSLAQFPTERARPVRFRLSN